jgi:hypothetical protein
LNIAEDGAIFGAKYDEELTGKGRAMAVVGPAIWKVRGA